MYVYALLHFDHQSRIYSIPEMRKVLAMLRTIIFVLDSNQMKYPTYNYLNKQTRTITEGISQCELNNLQL